MVLVKNNKKNKVQTEVYLHTNFEPMQLIYCVLEM